MRLLRWVLITIVCVLIILAVLIVATIRSPGVAAFVITKIASSPSDHIQVQNLTIGHQSVNFPFEWSFQDIKFHLLISNADYEVDLERLHLKLLSGLWAPETRIRIEAIRCNVRNEKISVGRATVRSTARFSNNQLAGLYGDFSLESADVQAYKFQNIQGQLRGNYSSLRLVQVTADAYAGKINGEVLMEYRPAVSYSINAHMQDISLDSLKTVNETLFSYVEGYVSGNVDMRYQRGGVESVGLELTMPQGGKLNTSLVKGLMIYIPIQVQNELESRVRDGDKFWAELVQVKLRSLNQETLSGLLQIESRELKTNFNIPVDIKMDGKLDRVVELFLGGFKKLFQ